MKRTRKEAIEAGEVRYFTGIECKRGHISERFSKSAKCLSCHYENNPPKGFYGKSEEHKRELARSRSSRWYKENKDLVKERASRWKKENPDKVAKSRRREADKAKTDPRRISIRFMRDSLRRTMKSKTGSTIELIGYSRRELIEHLEAQFRDGMSWDNYGKWEIDHKIPLSWFVWAGVNDPKVVNKLRNLQPLWSKENKGKWSVRRYAASTISGKSDRSDDGACQA